MNAKLIRAQAFAWPSLLAALLLAGCGGPPSDLQEFCDRTRAEQKPKIEPLPEFKPYEAYLYKVANLKDPFKPADFGARTMEVAKQTGTGVAIPQHDPEPLEAFPLDSLKMVGTLEQQSGLWALVRATDGTIHRVKTGNYLGQNYGKILGVNENSMQIMEIVPDGAGGLMERAASMKLAD
jgi:type IV pilus assembly protein PilP